MRSRNKVSNFSKKGCVARIRFLTLAKCVGRKSVILTLAKQVRGQEYRYPDFSEVRRQEYRHLDFSEGAWAGN